MLDRPLTDIKMLISVVICTWNRAASLDRTLRQMHSLRMPSGVEWELIVVNNNCTDQTDQVIERHSKDLPIRRLFEGTPGKSYACNLAVREAKGELVVWTDDDVLVDPGWLEAYVAAANDHPEMAFFGGMVDPWYDGQPPPWFVRNLKDFGKVVALKNFGSVIRPLEANELVIGANMALRYDVQKLYQYDALLTNRPGRQAGCEDHELIDRVRADGRRGLWVANAVVNHFIPKERMTLEFARRWWTEQAQVYVARFPSTCPAVDGKPPLWLRRKYVEATVRTWLFSLTRGERWAKAFFEAAWLKGLLLTCVEGPTKENAGEKSGLSAGVESPDESRNARNSKC